MEQSFSGNWQIDLSQSKVWDYQSGAYIPDAIGDERIRIDLIDDVQTYEVLLGDAPTIRISYTSRYDSPEWVPYSVRDITNFKTGDQSKELEDFVLRTHQRRKSFRVGDIYGMVRTVYVDKSTHYRISRDVDGKAEYAMMRKLDKTGASYTSYVFRTDGIVSTIRRFIREQ